MLSWSESARAGPIGAASIVIINKVQNRVRIIASRNEGMAASWRFPLVAAVVAFLVYAPSIAGDFVYDDGELILRNPSIRDLTAWRSIVGYEPARVLAMPATAAALMRNSRRFMRTPPR